jgi:ribosomal protein L37AE/L43A
MLRPTLYKLAAARTPAARTYPRPTAYFRQKSRRRAGRKVNTMFCPKCGQQTSDGVRFCPRCGLSLAGLPAYVANNEFAPVRPEPPQASGPTAKQLGTRRGAKLIFFSVVLFPIFFAFCILVDGPAPLFVPLTVFLAGLVVLVYARLFGEELLPARGAAARRDLNAGGERPALGAQQFTPASLFNQQRANTSEIGQPPSVTENTTRLLEKDS